MANSHIATVDQLEYLAQKSKAYTDKVKTKVETLETKVDGLVTAGGEPNTIETIKVNGTALTPDTDKAVDIEVPTVEDIESAIDTAIAAADHIKRKIVDSTDDIDLTADDATQYIYMVPKTDGASGDGYDEYMVIDGSLEKVGDWAVDLSDYVKKDEIATDAEVAAVIDPIFNPVTTPEVPEE